MTKMEKSLHTLPQVDAGGHEVGVDVVGGEHEKGSEELDSLPEGIRHLTKWQGWVQLCVRV